MPSEPESGPDRPSSADPPEKGPLSRPERSWLDFLAENAFWVGSGAVVAVLVTGIFVFEGKKPPTEYLSPGPSLAPPALGPSRSAKTSSSLDLVGGEAGQRALRAVPLSELEREARAKRGTPSGSDDMDSPPESDPLISGDGVKSTAETGSSPPKKGKLSQLLEKLADFKGKLTSSLLGGSSSGSLEHSTAKREVGSIGHRGLEGSPGNLVSIGKSSPFQARPSDKVSLARSVSSPFPSRPTAPKAEPGRPKPKVPYPAGRLSPGGDISISGGRPGVEAPLGGPRDGAPLGSPGSGSPAKSLGGFVSAGKDTAAAEGECGLRAGIYDEKTGACDTSQVNATQCGREGGAWDEKTRTCDLTEKYKALCASDPSRYWDDPTKQCLRDLAAGADADLCKASGGTAWLPDAKQCLCEEDKVQKSDNPKICVNKVEDPNVCVVRSPISDQRAVCYAPWQGVVCENGNECWFSPDAIQSGLKLGDSFSGCAPMQCIDPTDGSVTKDGQCTPYEDKCKACMAGAGATDFRKESCPGAPAAKAGGTITVSPNPCVLNDPGSGCNVTFTWSNVTPPVDLSVRESTSRILYHYPRAETGSVTFALSWSGTASLHPDGGGNPFFEVGYKVERVRYECTVTCTDDTGYPPQTCQFKDYFPKNPCTTLGTSGYCQASPGYACKNSYGNVVCYGPLSCREDRNF